MVGCDHNEARAIKFVVSWFLFQLRFYPGLAILPPGFVVGLIFSYVMSRRLMRHAIYMFLSMCRTNFAHLKQRPTQRSRTNSTTGTSPRMVATLSTSPISSHRSSQKGSLLFDIIVPSIEGRFNGANNRNLS
jgi:hypothetical protein